MREDCKYYSNCGNAENCANCNGYEKDIKKMIPWERMDEIASKCLHALYEAEPIEAMEYFREELDLTDEEMEYFCIPMETV